MSQPMQTVLILDDDDTVRESLVCLFEDRGCRVLSAATAEETFEVLRRESPDGAVVDIRLPGIDGNALMRAVSKTHPLMACVISTGSPEYRPPDDIAALPQVARQVFTKPVINLAELADTLFQQIEQLGAGVRGS